MATEGVGDLDQLSNEHEDEPSDAEVLNTAQQMVKALERRNNLLKWIVIAVFVVPLMLGIFQYQTWRQGHDIKTTQKNACLSGNNLRQGLLNIADTLEAAQHATNESRTPEQIKAGQDFIDELRRDFALRNCG